MANTFSMISVVCFILSGMSFVDAIILFYVMKTKAAYLELKGKPQIHRIIESGKKSDTEPLTRRINLDDAVTTILSPKFERSKKNV